MLTLDPHDEALVSAAKAAIEEAIASAHVPVAVIKRIVAFTVRHRNRGRADAIKRHPFKGICEASGKPLDRSHAHLDELEPELGYAGKVRWVCPRANNSGKYSCGGC
jgi:hypothetical protein